MILGAPFVQGPSVCQEDWVDFHRQLTQEHGAQYKAGFMRPWRGEGTEQSPDQRSLTDETQSSVIYQLYYWKKTNYS